VNSKIEQIKPVRQKLKLRATLIIAFISTPLYTKTVWVGRYQHVKPSWIMLQQEIMEVVAVETRTLYDAQNSSHITTFIPTGQMPFLLPNQQCHSTACMHYTNNAKKQIMQKSELCTMVISQKRLKLDYCICVQQSN